MVADFTLHNGGELILLDGSLHFSVKGECGRCLKPLVQPLVSTLEERYYPEGTENLPDDAFTYKFDVVDVTDALRGVPSADCSCTYAVQTGLQGNLSGLWS